MSACAADLAHVNAGLGDAVIEEASLGVTEGAGRRAGRATGEEDLIGGALRLGVGEGGFDFSDFSGWLAGELLHALATSLQVTDKAGGACAASLAHAHTGLIGAGLQRSRLGVQHRTVLRAHRAALLEDLVQLTGGRVWVGGRGDRSAGLSLHTLAVSLVVTDHSRQALAADLAVEDTGPVETGLQLPGKDIQYRTVFRAGGAAGGELFTLGTLFRIGQNGQDGRGGGDESRCKNEGDKELHFLEMVFLVFLMSLFSSAGDVCK